ncbi:hypothetical protein [Haloactinopolyspora sp.]|uniref:hypothetical protein n=1 Tax=Haloactinopolyspora sp. TaxID=1966353 RepID=UPI00260E3F42|nr:hypothetical protein [Haloactinopolyspora sp.]
MSRGSAVVVRVVPVWLRRLVRHEFALWASLLRWMARRGPHGVRAGDTAAGYARGQAVIMFGFLFASVVETVVLALIIPWPLVHLIALGLGLWGIWFVLALHASCVVRPHVIEADGSLRVRYGALIDIRIPEELIATVRRERRHPDGSLLTVDDGGAANLAVSGETSVTVELTEPVAIVRPLGRVERCRVVRFYAEDPRAVMAAIAAAAPPPEERASA